MKELSLFSGAGGGLLGTKLLRWECIGYVEFNEYCQRVIRARIDDGIFDEAPIFTDVREFIESGAADEYRGFADVVSGGFPCQPFSVAGKQAGADDPRNMWPQTIDIVRRVRPRFVYLENVPGLLSSGYMGTVFGDLAESGYDAKWRVLSAAELGAPHIRNRLWIVATDSQCKRGQGEFEKAIPRKRGLPWGKNVRGLKDLRNRPAIPSPRLCGVGNGVAARVDRLKAIGNGQVPAVVREAWELLTNEL